MQKFLHPVEEDKKQSESSERHMPTTKELEENEKKHVGYLRVHGIEKPKSQAFMAAKVDYREQKGEKMQIDFRKCNELAHILKAIQSSTWN